MAITLEEIAYIINGSLRVEDVSTGTAMERFRAALYDAIADPVMVDVPSKAPDRRFDKCEAKGTGPTPELAKQELVHLLRGRIISYEIPVMWTSSTTHLAVPPTLEAGETKKIPRLRVICEEEKAAREGKFKAVTLIDSEMYQVGDEVDSFEAAHELCALAARGESQLFQIYDDQGASRLNQ